MVDSSPGVPSTVDVFVREPAAPSGYRQARTFADSLGRTLATKREDVIDGVAKVVITGAVTFDAAGWVATRKQPTVAQQDVETYEVPAASVPAMAYQYDAKPSPTAPTPASAGRRQRGSTTTRRGSTIRSWRGLRRRIRCAST
jgi:hypothetical protein